MARNVKDIEEEIRSLCDDDKAALLRQLIAQPDGPFDPRVERAWLKALQRRYRELVDGNINGIPGLVSLSLLGNLHSRPPTSCISLRSLTAVARPASGNCDSRPPGACRT